MVQARKTTIIKPETPPADEITLAQLQHISQQDSAEQNSDDFFHEKTEYDMVNEVLAELGGASDAKVNVYLLESGKSPAFVGSYAPDTFSIDAIQSNYGAGEYQISIRSGGRIRGGRKIRIAKPIINVEQNGNINGLEFISKQIADSQAQTQELIKALISKESQPVKTTAELLNEMLLMKQVMGGAEKSGLDMKDFLTMLEVAKGLVPAQGEASTMDVLLEGVKGLAPMLAMGAQQQQMQQMPNMPRQVLPSVTAATNPIPAPAPAPAPANETVIEHSTENQDTIDMQMQERFFFNLLVSNAHNDNDPAPYAQMLLDVVGNDTAEQLLNQENWFKVLTEKDSRVQLYEAWFTELRAEILEIIENDKKVLTGEIDGDINSTNNTSDTIDNANASTESPANGNVATNT